MKQTIKLQDIYSADLYTRSRASELRASILDNADVVLIDFDNIGFMSRSFADEICNIMDDMMNKTFELINLNEDVMTMLSKVKESRCQERKRGIDSSKMYEFNDMESLSEFLLTM